MGGPLGILAWTAPHSPPSPVHRNAWKGPSRTWERWGPGRFLEGAWKQISHPWRGLSVAGGRTVRPERHQVRVDVRRGEVSGRGAVPGVGAVLVDEGGAGGEG